MCYTELHISLPESMSRASEKDKILIRATPYIEGWFYNCCYIYIFVLTQAPPPPLPAVGSPWYDFVSVKVQHFGREESVNYAARVLSFVELNSRSGDNEDGESDGIYAFIMFFVSALTEETKKPKDLVRRRVDKDDLSITHKVNNLPYIMRDPLEDTLYDLVDISTIQHGLWVEEDCNNPGRYWVMSFTN